MKYYFADKHGLHEAIEVEVEKCTLQCTDIKTDEQFDIVMDKEYFDDWMEKLKGVEK